MFSEIIHRSRTGPRLLLQPAWSMVINIHVTPFCCPRQFTTACNIVPWVHRLRTLLFLPNGFFLLRHCNILQAWSRPPTPLGRSFMIVQEASSSCFAWVLHLACQRTPTMFLSPFISLTTFLQSLLSNVHCRHLVSSLLHEVFHGGLPQTGIALTPSVRPHAYTSACMQDVAAACIFLATKTEECGRKLRDVARVSQAKITGVDVSHISSDSVASLSIL